MADLDAQAPDWDKKREKIIDVLQSDTQRFQQYEKNGNRLKMWSLVTPDKVSSFFLKIFLFWKFYKKIN